MRWIRTEPLKIERINIAIADLPASLEGTKIVQLSDLHYDGLRLNEELLAEAIAITNEAEADLIVITGDFVTDEPEPIQELVLRLKHLQSRLGVYAILGNHDNYFRHSRKLITETLTSIDIRVLWNEIAYPFGVEFPLVGLADFWSRDFQPAPIMEKLNSKVPRLVLSHNPDTAKILQTWRVDLQLSGHTHGGQIILPLIGPLPSLIYTLGKELPKPLRKYIPFVRSCSHVVKDWQYFQGWHQLGKNQLYVNRGLGTYAPGRLFCPPEVSIFTLAAR